MVHPYTRADDISRHSAHPLPSLFGLLAVWTLLLFLLANASICTASEASQTRPGDDGSGSSGELMVPFNVGGATFITGGQVVLGRAVGGDALLAGGSVDIEASVGQDLYAAGGIVGLAHTVGGDARIAAGRVLITSSSFVKGSATIAAGNVVVNGRIGKSLLISAGRTEINGEIHGDLFVSGGSLSLGRNALVHGKVEYQGLNRPSSLRAHRSKAVLLKPRPQRCCVHQSAWPPLY